MKKILITLMCVVLGVGAVAFAGPTLGFGVGFTGDMVAFAPSVGMQYLPSRGIGVSTTMHLAELSLTGGSYFGVDIAYDGSATGFWEILTVTVPVANLTGGVFGDPCVDEPCPEPGGKLLFLAGLGTPYNLAWTDNTLDLGGTGVGLTFGLAIESFRGHGLKILGYYNGVDAIGFGVTTYFDLFSGRTRGIWNR